jgi:replicative DNA helicase
VNLNARAKKQNKKNNLEDIFLSKTKNLKFRCSNCGFKNEVGNYLTRELKNLNLLSNKHIPKQYLFSSKEQRLQLLSGLVDSDGHVAGSGIEITTKFPKLRDNIVWLCRSLGFRVSWTERFTGPDNSWGPYYRVSFYGDVTCIPLKIKRKLDKLDYKNIRNPILTGVNVEEAGVGKWAGFELEGDEKLFMLSDFTVTHNSTWAANIGAVNIRMGKTVFHVSLEIKGHEVLAKYASRMTGMELDQIFDKKDPKYRTKIGKFRSISPNLYVQYYTESTVDCLTVRAWISRIRAAYNVKPDVIIIDYDDCLLPTTKIKDNMYLEGSQIYADLKALADYFDCPIFTFAQPNRAAFNKVEHDEMIESSDLAHSAKKAMKATSISSLNFKKDDAFGWFYMDIVRRGVGNKKIPLKRILEKAAFVEEARPRGAEDDEDDDE